MIKLPGNITGKINFNTPPSKAQKFADSTGLRDLAKDEAVFSLKTQSSTVAAGGRFNVKKTLTRLSDIARRSIRNTLHLSSFERKLLNESFSGLDFSLFRAVLHNKKPAGILSFKDERIGDIYKKISSSDIDTVFCKNANYHGETEVFLINKRMVFDIIDDNKKFLTSRLALKPDATLDEIYTKIAGKDGILEGDSSGITSKFNDVIGLVLGYPKTSSILFELEKRSNVAHLRYDAMPPRILEYYKEKLLETLYSENSPYKGQGKEFIENLAGKIKSITDVKPVSEEFLSRGYQFIQFVDEPSEIARIMGY